MPNQHQSSETNVQHYLNNNYTTSPLSFICHSLIHQIRQSAQTTNNEFIPIAKVLVKLPIR